MINTRIKIRPVTSIIGLLVAVSGLTSCATVLDREYYSLKKPDEALRYLDRRILFNPFFTDARLERGHVLYNAHRYRDAINDFEKVSSAKSDCLKCVVSMQTMIGSSYLALEDPEHARIHFQMVKELAPNDARGPAGLGLVALKDGKTADAVEAFSEAIRLDPKEPSYYGNRGLAFVNAQNVSRGIEDYTTALTMDPKYVQCYLNRGLALLDSDGRAGDAEKDFSRAAELDPSSAVAWNGRGYARHLQGKLAEALADYDKALALNPAMTQALGNRAQLYLQTGRIKESASEYEKVTLMVPQDSLPHFNRGTALLILGESEAGIVELNKAEAIGFRPPDLYLNRGVGLRTVGRAREAEKDFNRALEMRPEWPEAHAERGINYLTLCQPTKAADDFRTTIALQPERTSSYYFLAISLEYAGQTSESIQAYERYAAMKIPEGEISYIEDAKASIHKLKTQGSAGQSAADGSPATGACSKSGLPQQQK